jgi:hypothetical protein
VDGWPQSTTQITVTGKTKYCPSATLSTTNPTQSGFRQNPATQIHSINISSWQTHLILFQDFVPNIEEAIARRAQPRSVCTLAVLLLQVEHAAFTAALVYNHSAATAVILPTKCDKVLNHSLLTLLPQCTDSYQCIDSYHNVLTLLPQCTDSCHNVLTLLPQCTDSYHNVLTLLPQCTDSCHIVLTLLPQCTDTVSVMYWQLPQCTDTVTTMHWQLPQCTDIVATMYWHCYNNVLTVATMYWQLPQCTDSCHNVLTVTTVYRHCNLASLSYQNTPSDKLSLAINSRGPTQSEVFCSPQG